MKREDTILPCIVEESIASCRYPFLSVRIFRTRQLSSRGGVTSHPRPSTRPSALRSPSSSSASSPCAPSSSFLWLSSSSLSVSCATAFCGYACVLYEIPVGHTLHRVRVRMKEDKTIFRMRVTEKREKTMRAPNRREHMCPK